MKYKFKDWSTTETKKQKVTESMKKRRAKEIADKLNDVRLWNSHGYGINMEKLTTEVKLKVDDFGTNPDMHKKYEATMGCCRISCLAWATEAWYRREWAMNR
ncbi:MAG TPA: hypothetical protein VHB27_19735 [Rhodopila sp.]|uniref:hypothetical protein n=1 Tax=Rhodopila sp. TaxID=2480087 RepID=UPI002C03B96B|nr:hypothetical protein [Rhodopila sp.]HVY17464.1 hypothetical protein [Rhodopila sp.]